MLKRTRVYRRLEMARRLLPVLLVLPALLAGAANAGASCASYCQHVLATPGLLNYWQLGESSGSSAGIEQSYGGTTAGNYSSGVLLGQGAAPGLAYDPGKTAVTVPAGEAVTFPSVWHGGSGTIEFWAKPTLNTINGSTYREGVLRTSGWYCEFDTVTVSWSRLWCESGNAAWLAYNANGPGAGAWAHFALVFSAQSLPRIYVNGVIDNSNDFGVGGGPSNAGSLMAIGANDVSNNIASNFNYTPVSVSDVAIYGRALSPSEILADYQLGADPASVPPVPRAKPLLSAASAQVGSPIDCQSAGAFSGATTVSYQWLRDGQPIAGATSASYTPVAGDTGTTLSCRVTAQNANGQGQQTTPGVSVAAGPGSGSGADGVTGNSDSGSQLLPPAKQTGDSAQPAAISTGGAGGKGGSGSEALTLGQILSCEPGDWSGSPEFGYQWLRNGQPVTGATSASYTLSADDAGTQLVCRITAINSAGTSISSTSPLQIPDAIARPAISGLSFPRFVLSRGARTVAFQRAMARCAKLKRKARGRCVAKAQGARRVLPLFKFNLNRSARIELRIVQLARGYELQKQLKKAGRRAGGCRILRFKQRAPARSRPCALSLPVGRLGPATRKSGPGRIALKPSLLAKLRHGGQYRVSARASSSLGLRSDPVTIKFSVR